MSRTHRLFGLLAAALLAVLIVPLAALATSDTDPGFTASTSSATLTLVTGNETLTVTFAEEGETPVVVEQSLRKRDKCVIDTARFSSVIGLKLKAGGAVGLVDNGLGSSDAKNCSSGNGRVSHGEALVVTMPDGWIATGAQLDIEGKFGASLDVTTVINDQSTTVEGITLNTDDNSDNGADSGASDNTYVDFAEKGLGNFTSVELSPRSDDQRGEISLEGGGDAPGLLPTVFTLSRFYEYPLGCEDTASRTFSEGGVASGTGVPIDAPLSASVLRYDVDGKDGAECLPIGASIRADAESITFDNTDTSTDNVGQSPNLRLTLVWQVSLYNADGSERSAADVNAELDREIDLLDGTPLGLVQSCLIDNDDVTGPGLQPAEQPNGSNWCLLSDTTVVINGYLVQTQVYDGAGDPRWQ